MPEHPLLQALEPQVVYLPRSLAATGECSTAAIKHAWKPEVQAIAEEYFTSPDRLHGDTVPSQTIAKEQPIHRMMLWMHAQGANVADIARNTGYTPGAVRNVIRQPWARARLVQILKETGLDPVKHFLSHEVAPSLETFREVRDDPKSPPMAKLTAADKILDRALGKPIAKIESDNTNRNVPADLQRLEQEIADTRKALGERGLLENANGTN